MTNKQKLHILPKANIDDFLKTLNEISRLNMNAKKLKIKEVLSKCDVGTFLATAEAVQEIASEYELLKGVKSK
jgi:hypothetical protein